MSFSVASLCGLHCALTEGEGIVDPCLVVHGRQLRRNLLSRTPSNLVSFVTMQQPTMFARETAPGDCKLKTVPWHGARGKNRQRPQKGFYFVPKQRRQLFNHTRLHQASQGSGCVSVRGTPGIYMLSGV